MLELYHFEPVANSMKPLLALSEKGIDFVSRQRQTPVRVGPRQRRPPISAQGDHAQGPCGR